MQYCIYLRKSRADQEAEARGEGETLARHEKILLETAQRMQLNIVTIYREIVSGETIAARPVMQRLLQEVEQGLWTGVLVMEIERLARGDTMDQGLVAQTFKFSGTKIITPIKTYDPTNEMDEEYFEFGLFMSRREYKTINRRLQSGRLASAKEGNYLGNVPPYGYTRIKSPQGKGYTLAIQPEEAPVVQQIFQLYTKGELQPNGSWQPLGASLIAQTLNQRQIPPRKGPFWSAATIRGILANPVYIGKIRWNHRPAVKKMVQGALQTSRPQRSADQCLLVQGKHPAIIDTTTWQAAQTKCKAHTPLPRQKTIQNPLAGLVKCGCCGRTMVRRPNPNYPDVLMCPEPQCPNVSAKLSLVEAAILDSLKDWLANYQLTWQTTPSQDQEEHLSLQQQAIQQLEKELQKLNQQQNQIHDLLEQGVYDVETFLRRHQILTEKIDQTTTAKSQLEEKYQQAQTYAKSQQTLVPKINHLLSVYAELTSAQAKNDLLKTVLKKVTYTKENKGRWHHKEDDFAITIYPKLTNS